MTTDDSTDDRPSGEDKQEIPEFIFDLLSRFGVSAVKIWEKDGFPSVFTEISQEEYAAHVMKDINMDQMAFELKELIDQSNPRYDIEYDKENLRWLCYSIRDGTLIFYEDGVIILGSSEESVNNAFGLTKNLEELGALDVEIPPITRQDLIVQIKKWVEQIDQ